MTRKKKQLPIFENVTITDVAAAGKAITRVNDMVVFVPFCVPGDVVDLQVKRKKHSYCEAEVIRFIKYSPDREDPPCPNFGVCGGCKWQNLPYPLQLKAKQQQVEDQLKRIGKVRIPEISPILGSERIYEYRNKLEFACCNKRWLTREQVASGETFDNMNATGFHITGAFDKIYPISKCLLMDDLHNEIRNAIDEYANKNDIPFFDVRQQTGLLRDLVIRHAEENNQWMLIVQFKFENQNDKEQAMKLLQFICDKFPQLTSVFYVNNTKCNDIYADLPLILFKGEDHILEKMGDLQFRVGPKSFYQTNTHQAFNLYNVAKNFANLSGNELVYDLYTGTGTIANFVARNAKQVIGIEYVEDAIVDAKRNSELNNINNTLFYAGDMKDILTDQFIAEHGRPDVIITDPPRAGMHPDVVRTILNAAPERIVYVSCNPATQARDLALMDEDYQVIAVQPVDMFPHTPHVENVVLLEKRKKISIFEC